MHIPNVGYKVTPLLDLRVWFRDMIVYSVLNGTFDQWNHVEHFVCSSICWKQHVEPLSLRTQALIGRLTHQTLPIANWTFGLGVYMCVCIYTYIYGELNPYMSKGARSTLCLEWSTNCEHVVQSLLNTCFLVYGLRFHTQVYTTRI